MSENVSFDLKEIQLQIDEMNLNHFYIISADRSGKVVLAGSFDFSYYHEIEIHFHEVSFISCPMDLFMIDTIRLATIEESKTFSDWSCGYHDGFVICLEEKNYKHKFFLAKGMVY
ncbi:hypothetical protein [Paenibacillus anseongense]|uniref:hypothetical protein n=1 Tax=Paenibacillus anseongense TaxID=2682845 RepID=UPI002DB6C3B3|nr:hypothetical protein [Paenibacillus anseongense]MEC0267015.1 hypothetical protein [Paenibacillus anseongense]